MLSTFEANVISKRANTSRTLNHSHFIIYAIEDPDEKLDIFNKLVGDCIERHAPLKRTKITRPPAPWLHDDNIRDLQKQRDSLRHQAHTLNTTNVWQAFRDVRNRLKTKIKEAKKSFVNKAFSSSKPKEIWRVIHRVLNPSPQPLRVDVDELNKFFASTAQRTVAGHFAERHFAERHFAERHFAERTFCRRTFCRTDVLPNGHFAERTFCRTDSLPNGQLAENRDIF